ncbi:hyaluronidase [Heterostelium album PN500]|uniref:Hyaluronidase n=1 Tax=Heterostelium pallidum (strain ATCC 26659 / Pp 5 / PN500) TaxID=670386 RepID=D3B293_HETP5|nr:hyaluronidase [Heterostelium album PN500]EFA84468.1 hyaluronidase [Heterostelium album PN500]|eukprot:XP_020436582.1 hyaluronidase [Heterostelium album PN500]
MTLWGFTPAYYYMETTRSTWNQNLQTIDGIASTIPMIFTGESITESTFDSSKFPNLQSNRPLVVWDNWIAEDTNTRIPWGMIDQRIANNMFASPYGYILNLCYPLERVIHHIYCLGKIAKVSSVAQPQPKCDVTQTGSYWSTWLNQNGFLHNNQNVNTVATGLTAAINDDQFYESIAQFEAANPTLQGIFSTPPTPTTTTTTNTTTSTTSTSPTSTSTTGKTTTTTNSPTTTTTSTPTATTGTTTTTTNSTTTTTGTTTTTTTASTTTTTDSSTTSDVNESNKMTYNILLILTFLILLIIN